jgi:GMP synthase (glutamine-hydrolysing)
MNKKKALMIVHQPRSSTGDVGFKLRDRGYELDVRRPVIGEKLPNSMNEHDLAVIYGGPPSANDNIEYIKYEIDWISKALSSNKPFLGICLGAQMLAKNLGGTVQRAPNQKFEIGFYDIHPTGEGHKVFQKQKTFFQWHKEGFSVPSSCDVLAYGATFPQQAFKYKNAIGIQFHPEVNLRMHLRWLYFAGYMLREKGAQKRHLQLRERVSHGKKINMWLDSFIDNYFLTDKS